MFHLMTHAFFKALLFMAAGSVIAAMAGNQDLDRMGGFRKAMPFTFACMVVGGLALSGVPPFSGFFSKDEILADRCSTRGGWHVVLAVLGYVGAFLTAIYTFRMIFRAFFGEPCAEARELEHGHLYHAPEHTNPATGEVEDTDVGFPGPEHHIAEREWPMKIAMGVLAVLADRRRRRCRSRSVTDVAAQVPRADVRRLAALRGARAVGQRGRSSAWPSAPLLGVLGIAHRLPLWVQHPERAGGDPRARSAALHRFFVNKWYFDEAIDVVVVRPIAWFGRFARNDVRARARQRRARRRHVRRRARRLGRRARRPDRLPALLRRAAARRPRRPRPLLPDLGMTIHLSILLFWPLALGVLGALAPRRAAPVFALVGALVPLVYAVADAVRLRAGARGLQYVTDDTWIPELGIHYKLGVDGLNLWLVALTTLLFAASALWLVLRPPPRAALFALPPRARRDRRAGRVPGAGPGAVRPLLRPDARPVLLPGRDLGRARPDRGRGEDGHLHARRLAADARRGGRDRGALRARRGRADASRSPTSSRNRLPESTQKWLFLAFALAFLIKMPAFPFHGWMPDAYRAMPLPALAVFSGVLSKVAAYGFLRIVLPLFPDAVAATSRRSCSCSRCSRSSTAR